jgi:hypothetical protein
MPDEKMLREKARAAVQSGKPPSRSPDRTWGGPGVGATCSVCGLPVTQDENEFEIQFAHDGDNPGLDKRGSSSGGASALHERRADVGGVLSVTIGRYRCLSWRFASPA